LEAVFARRSLAGALGRQFETAAYEGTILKSSTEGSPKMSSIWWGAGVGLVAVSGRLRPAAPGASFVPERWARGIPGRGDERGAVSKQP